MSHLTVAADRETQQTRPASPLRTRLAYGASLLPRVAVVAVTAFLALYIGAPWLLFDAPPSPFEAVALKALCHNAAGTQAACLASGTDPAHAMGGPTTLQRRLK